VESSRERVALIVIEITEAAAVTKLAGTDSRPPVTTPAPSTD